MKHLLISLLFIFLLSCKKETKDNYFPKIGDTTEKVVKFWGEPGAKTVRRYNNTWIMSFHYYSRNVIVKFDNSKVIGTE